MEDTKDLLFYDYKYSQEYGSTPQYTAIIKIGNWHIQLIDKTFTPEQIEHMREYFGWEVENLCE